MANTNKIKSLHQLIEEAETKKSALEKVVKGLDIKKKEKDHQLKIEKS